ncbi:hypothetical protein D3C84_903010 [compost metagenome]
MRQPGHVLADLAYLGIAEAGADTPHHLPFAIGDVGTAHTTAKMFELALQISRGQPREIRCFERSVAARIGLVTGRATLLE